LRSNQHSASCHAVWHVIKFLLLVGTACAGNSGLSSFLGEHELEMAFCAHAMLQQRAVIGSADAGVWSAQWYKCCGSAYNGMCSCRGDLCSCRGDLCSCRGDLCSCRGDLCSSLGFTWGSQRHAAWGSQAHSAHSAVLGQQLNPLIACWPVQRAPLPSCNAAQVRSGPWEQVGTWCLRASAVQGPRCGRLAFCVIEASTKMSSFWIILLCSALSP